MFGKKIAKMIMGVYILSVVNLSTLTQEMPFVDSYPFETIIAQSEKIQNQWVDIKGVANIKDEGVEVYYTINDYLYSTRENAIWIPEREEYPIKEYIENRDIQQGKASTFSVIVQPGTSGYAATGIYLDERTGSYAGDKVYQKFAESQKIENEIDYNTTDDQEAERVSYYRLMGNPWAFDGRKIKVEVLYSMEEPEGVSVNQEVMKTNQSLVLAQMINGESIKNYEEIYQKIVETYEKQGVKSINDIQLALLRPKRLHFWLEGSFFLYQKAKLVNGESQNYVQPTYLLSNIDIHEKDWEQFMKNLSEAEVEK